MCLLFSSPTPSYRHLGSELTEMLRVIDTLMTEEFERYSTADLNRPLLDSEPLILEGVSTVIPKTVLSFKIIDPVDSHSKLIYFKLYTILCVIHLISCWRLKFSQQEAY